MAAIALAESGGRPTALNPTDNGGTQTSWGLWQISNGTHSSPAPAGQNPLDPAVNAKMAVGKYNASKALSGNGFLPWGTYDSGVYRQFLQSGVAPDTAGIPATLMSDTSSGGSDPNTKCVIHVPLVGCVLTVGQLHKVEGALILIAGGVVGGGGLLLLAAYGLNSTKAKAMSRLVGKTVGLAGALPGVPTPAPKKTRQQEKGEKRAFEEGRKTGHYERDQETPF